MGMMADYRVRVGEFRIYVKVLNLHIEAKVEDQKVGKGTFGVILEKHVAKQKFVVKMQKRNITK
jgi:hypothetical protein